MSGATETHILVFAVLGLLLLGPMIIVNDLIVRDVCRREGKTYSFWWLISPHWAWRIFKWSWYREAREAGYLTAYSVLSVAWLGYVVSFIYFFPDII